MSIIDVEPPSFIVVVNSADSRIKYYKASIEREIDHILKARSYFDKR